MHISDYDQQDADIDWFATDAAGQVLHVASGGGRLPGSVAASEEVLLELHAYFLNLPAATTAEPGEGVSVTNVSYPGHARYARRGLFSYGKMDLHQAAHPEYLLAARPVRPLLLAELPPRLATLLARTRLPGNAAHTPLFNSTTIL